MSGSIQIIEDQWPVVIHRSQGAPTAEQLDAYVRQATELLLRGQRHAVVMDASGLTNVTAYARMSKKDWLQQYERELRTHCAGTALVLSSPLHRFISATLMLFAPFPTPYKVFGTVEEAVEWARAKLAAS